MPARLSILAAVLTVSGCSSFEWSRLAPPGLVKYENIADEKPPNPAIAEEIAQRRETERPRYPVLSRTPAGGEPPPKPEKAEIRSGSAELVTARDGLSADLDADRAAVEADREERALLDKERDSLARQIEQDAAAPSANARNRRSRTISEDRQG